MGRLGLHRLIRLAKLFAFFAQVDLTCPWVSPRCHNLPVWRCLTARHVCGNTRRRDIEARRLGGGATEFGIGRSLMKKQLVLRKETLRNLASRQLLGVRGGGTNTETVTDSWWITDCSCDTIPPWTWVDDTFTIRFGSNDMCIV